ncbi:DUF2281 domain-containing protein [Synechocystis salina LEGE 06155]|nr:DUF2281 domain-containing protein [Synechocystis salina LEGE 06155]
MDLQETLSRELESAPESILLFVLNYIRFLKNQQTNQLQNDQVASSEIVEPQSLVGLPKSKTSCRSGSGRSILRHAGTWQGDDFETCLQSVYATRSETQFDDNLNSFD